MKTPTKNIISRDDIIKELLKRNKRDITDILIVIGISMIIDVILILALISTDFPPFYSVFSFLFISAPFVLLGDCLWKRRRILRGDFEITTKAVMRKNDVYREYNYDKTLYFKGFWRYPLHDSGYEIASIGDPYYIIHFKNSKFIQMVYPLKAYEIKEEQDQ